MTEKLNNGFDLGEFLLNYGFEECSDGVIYKINDILNRIHSKQDIFALYQCRSKVFIKELAIKQIEEAGVTVHDSGKGAHIRGRFYNVITEDELNESTEDRIDPDRATESDYAIDDSNSDDDDDYELDGESWGG